MENYSLLMGDSSGDEDGGGVDGGAFRGHFPVPVACRNRLLSPRSWLRDGGGSGTFLVPWLIRIGVLGIDQIIDSTAGCERLSFLDAYSGYNQIRLKEDDEAKTAFITPYGVFCYKTMPFGLKNAGATYQRMMQKCLATQIGKNVQVYIDDVVITSKKGSTLIEDLKETFDNLDKFCLKLNPTKCSFGLRENFSGS
ncbi:hypothetical protein QYE76_056963 [Lolium multiflorum]|uniref:Reverse transcriptase domain-containing protein n=1 Tax=Lolium multiflorum TaxID=4521 RepID=A0AAD8T3R1_LOLMU|nr:hypothetical protein QYE76_056963 [Lolium multiflorum]